MARRTVIYDDFSKGEFGRIEPWNAPRGSWTGQNMLVYSTGEIGLRTGLRDISPSNLSANTIATIGTVPSDSEAIWYQQLTEINSYTATQSPAGNDSLDGTLTSTPNKLVYHHTGPTTYMITNNTGAYSYNGLSLTKLTGSPSGVDIALLDQRLVISTSTNTLRFSAPANFLSWPAANVIAIGDGNSSGGLAVQRTHLTIWKDNEGVYILTGVPGVNEVVRKAVSFLGTPGGGTARNIITATQSDIVWAQPGQSSGGMFPIAFDGASLIEFPNIPAPPPQLGVVSMIDLPWLNGGGIMIISEDSNQRVGGLVSPALIFSNGAWTRHLFEIDHFLGGQGTAISHISFNDPAGIFAAGQFLSMDDLRPSTGIILFTNDAPGAAIYSFAINVDRPGSETAFDDTVQERAGDLSDEQVTGFFHLPEWWSDEGSEVMVRAVHVDFRKWDTGGSLTNHMDVVVDALRFHNADAPRSSATSSWDEASGSASSGGTLTRETFSFGDQGVGNGFQLKFTNCRGIAIKRIEVVIESQPSRGH